MRVKNNEILMDTYVLVSFWLGVITLAINLICVAGVSYPKVKEETLGQKVFQVLVRTGS